MPAPAPTSADRIQLYSLGTPNGQKVAIMLEECGLEYDAHTVNIIKGEQFQDWFLEISPNNKIPAITDPNGPDGKPINIMETGAILLYLAEKTCKFGGSTPRAKVDVIQWLMWQMAGFGPMLGQMGHFHKYAKDDIPYAKERYLNEAKRLYGVLEKQLEGKAYVVGDEYTIADMAIYPWHICVDKFYGLKEAMGNFPNVDRWAASIESRPAVPKGMAQNAFPRPTNVTIGADGKPVQN